MRALITKLTLFIVITSGHISLGQIVNVDNNCGVDCIASVRLITEHCADWAYSPMTIVPQGTFAPAIRNWANVNDWRDGFSNTPMTIPCTWNWSHAIVLFQSGLTVMVGNNVTNCLGSFPSIVSNITGACQQQNQPFTVEWISLPASGCANIPDVTIKLY